MNEPELNEGCICIQAGITIYVVKSVEFIDFICLVG